MTSGQTSSSKFSTPEPMNPSRSLVVRRDDTRCCFVFGEPENQDIRYTLSGKMFGCASQLRIHRGAYVVPLITGEAMRSLRLVVHVWGPTLASCAHKDHPRADYLTQTNILITSYPSYCKHSQSKPINTSYRQCFVSPPRCSSPSPAWPPRTIWRPV